MILKSMLWRSALAALVTTMLTFTGSAQTISAQPGDRDHDPAEAWAQEGGECKEKLNAAGRAKFRPFTQAREIRGEGAAMADAIANWQRDVSARYGTQWMLWDKAQEKSFNCGAARPGTIGSWFIRCTIEARPCGGGPSEPPDEQPEPERRTCEEYPRHRILEAQQRMNGCNTCGRQITVDGKCGPQTERCLRAFQSSRFGRQHGLEVNGAPDRKTIVALREFCER
jgi:hypothetical protein